MFISRPVHLDLSMDRSYMYPRCADHLIMLAISPSTDHDSYRHTHRSARARIALPYRVPYLLLKSRDFIVVWYSVSMPVARAGAAAPDHPASGVKG